MRQFIIQMKKRRKLWLSIALAILAVVPKAYGEDVSKVSEFTLKNGLKILVREDHRSPIVVSQIWYRIGSSFELTGSTGVSHVLEHMMFKGTDRFGPGELSNLVARYGGTENAFTGRDYTGYYQVWEKSRLPLSFALEANRMKNLKMDPKEFEKEKKVVMEERRLRTDDSPVGTAIERLYAAAYLSSPYQNPVIGWMQDIQRLTLEYTKRWYEQWYAPNNATLIVVGDVNPQEVFKLAETHFGSLEPKEMPLLPLYDEQPSKGEKRITVEEKVKVPQIIMGYLTPSISTVKSQDDIYALSMLANVLDGGLSARFETQLVRKNEIVSSIGTGYDPLSRGDALFTIMAAPSQNHSLEDVEKAIKEQIQNIIETPPSQDELERALVQSKASEVFAEDSVFNRAETLGRFAVIDQDWHLADTWVDTLSKVTPEDVQRVAKKYLNDKRLTLVNLVPDSQSQGAVQ